MQAAFRTVMSPTEEAGVSQPCASLPLRILKTHATHCTVTLRSLCILLNVNKYKCNCQQRCLVTLQHTNIINPLYMSKNFQSTFHMLLWIKIFISKAISNFRLDLPKVVFYNFNITTKHLTSDVKYSSKERGGVFSSSCFWNRSLLYLPDWHLDSWSQVTLLLPPPE